MESSGWTKVRLSDVRDCFIWLKISSVQSCCYLIDQRDIYTETLDHNQLKERYEELNPDIEIDDVNLLVKEIARVMENNNTSTTVISDNGIDLKCDWSEDFINQTFTFSLSKSSAMIR